MTHPSTTSPSTQGAFDAQLAYLLSGRAAAEGSPAIAIGRTAGLAQELGLSATAAQCWSHIPALPDMPPIAAFHRGYMANPEAFAAFAAPGNFPAGGTPFGNAAGSYAYACEFLSRGPTALHGGEAEYACKWGAAALRVAGFAVQAEAIERVWANPTPPQAPVAGADVSASKIDMALVKSI